MGIASGSLRDNHLAVRTIADTMAGLVVLAATDAGVISLEMRAAEGVDRRSFQPGELGAAKIADRAMEEVKAYFKGELRDFSVRLCLDGLSEFQRRVLEHVARIPFGKVQTYGEVAMKIGKANSARAVGGALARNPIGIIVPCHRVVAHDGRLHGFTSPDGIRLKAKLLQHEGIVVWNERVQLEKQLEV